MVKIRVVNPLAETTLVQLFFDNLTGTLDKDALVINKRHERICRGKIRHWSNFNRERVYFLQNTVIWKPKCNF